MRISALRLSWPGFHCVADALSGPPVRCGEWFSVNGDRQVAGACRAEYNWEWTSRPLQGPVDALVFHVFGYSTKGFLLELGLSSILECTTKNIVTNTCIVVYNIPPHNFVHVL